MSAPRVPAALVLLLALGAGQDPGVVLELDRESFTVIARDLRGGEMGPPLRVALGSPAHPTPVGSFPLREVVRDPAWLPGPLASAAGAQPTPPSSNGPLGVAKLPFSGPYALHGGSRSILLGKPVTLGCVRSADAALLGLLAWLAGRGALGPERPTPSSGRRQRLVRPVHLVIR